MAWRPEIRYSKVGAGGTAVIATRYLCGRIESYATSRHHDISNSLKTFAVAFVQLVMAKIHSSRFCLLLNVIRRDPKSPMR
jgi:hypothetical protein